LYADCGNGEDGSEEGISDVTTPDGMMTIEMLFPNDNIGEHSNLPATLPSFQLSVS
jgi:hypothetical protein